MRFVALFAMASVLVACSDNTPSEITSHVDQALEARDIPFVIVAPEPKIHSWWLRAEYHPYGREVRGIPVAQIHASWCKANELTRELFPADLLTVGGEDMLKDAGNSFVLTGKFDGKNQLTALVGVYETCDKEKGTFLLIVNIDTANKPAVVFVELFPNMQQFASLYHTQENEIDLWWCYRCNHHQELLWDQTKQAFVWKPEPSYL